jgi:hypothetical protein
MKLVNNYLLILKLNEKININLDLFFMKAFILN